MTETLFLIGDLILLVAAVGAIVFAVSYAVFFNWRKTAAGRALLYFVVSLVIVFLNNAAARLIGPDYPLREWVRLAVYVGVAATIWHLVHVLWRNWRTHRPPLDIEPRRDDRPASKEKS